MKVLKAAMMELLNAALDTTDKECIRFKELFIDLISELYSNPEHYNMKSVDSDTFIVEDGGYTARISAAIHEFNVTYSFDGIIGLSLNIPREYHKRILENISDEAKCYLYLLGLSAVAAEGLGGLGNG